MNQTGEQWSIGIGRWRGVSVRLHMLFPMLAIVVLLLVDKHKVDPITAAWSLVVLLGSVFIHELVRVITASRVGGHASSLVISPLGGFSQLHLPADPPAHLIAALVGPMVFLVLLISSACCLVFAGERHILHLLQVTGPVLEHPESWLISAKLCAQLVVWTNALLLIISMLPIYPCAGAELLRGTLWPIVGRDTAYSVTSHVALGVAFMAALISVGMLRKGSGTDLIPIWFPLGVIAVLLLYCGRRQAQAERYDHGLAIDEFDSDDEEWLFTEWTEEEREVVLVEHLQDKQQEALDRKRKEREATEDARVDDILLRLNDTSFEQLSEEEQAILKRASRRYRDRRKPDLDE